MLLLMIPLGFGFVRLRDYLDTRPINWVPYSASNVEEGLRNGKTVLVNFRAEWDIATVRHERMALDRPRVAQWMRMHDVIALRADYTHGSPEIAAALQSIGLSAIPAVAVFAASHPDNPIVLTGAMSEEQVLTALEHANGKR